MGRRVNPTFNDTDPEVQKYLLILRASKCPLCGRKQRTPRGEGIPCPKCTGGDESMDRPTVPMGQGRSGG
jgi:hypothetical protein